MPITPDESCPSCTPETAIAELPRNISNHASSDSFDSQANDQDLATLCKALGHPARVRILKILIERQSCICGEIVDVMPLAQSTVSEHLRILKQVNLVQGEVEGKRICYCVNPITLNRLKALVGDL
ncbi:MAG: winged helix-turn-helix transcriptional regulator [Merismopedia sp. SIO2A8]|nr:winged helix-turn-helix transcriptional regulator [Symploca sp. SIO2B6]NET49992.1 winged helix-turn-helix transcriptional regulator [Merismopedia sp. SIO2A8]